MENGDAHDARKWGCTLCDLKYRGDCKYKMISKSY